MSTKVLLKILVLCGLLAVIFMTVQLVHEASTPARAEASANTNRSLVGSDWIERHPTNKYAGSDWIERHPTIVRDADTYAGSDWIERHPGGGRP